MREIPVSWSSRKFLGSVGSMENFLRERYQFLGFSDSFTPPRGSIGKFLCARIQFCEIAGSHNKFFCIDPRIDENLEVCDEFGVS